MVNSCCVAGCKNESYPGSCFSFHGFPNNENQKMKWENVVPGKITKSSVVCSAHFKCDDFIPGYTRKMLKADAVPSIFPKVVPCNKRVHVLSNICIEEGVAPKMMKLQESGTKEITTTTESVCTQTTPAAIPATPRKKKLRRKVKVLQQRLNRRNTTIDNLKSLLKIIKKKCDNYSEVEQMVQHNFENIHTSFNTKKSNTSNKYSDEMKSFALSLYYYSGKAYLFLRNRIHLPHPATLRRILATHKCKVGFMAEVMEFLKVKAEKGEMNVALIFDAMAIKASKQYDKGADKYWGRVDLGGILTSDFEIFAKEALVFQIVSLKEKFICPIAYFFIDKISAHVQAQLVLTAIRMLGEINIVVRSLTADGTQVNIKTFETLGCNFNLQNIKTYFDHPIKSTKVYCILDPAHMIKLARNLLAETCLSSEKGDIKFAYIQKLQDLQEEEGLKLKNKLTRVHVNFYGKKMNVRLAAQVLSSSVADAIDYLRSIGHPSFAGSEATVEYLRYLDRLFDILNAKNPIGTGFKSPLRLNNKHVWTQVFEESRKYLTVLKVDGETIMTHRRKTPVLGLIIDTYSFAELATDMFDANMTYLLPYKASQDHIEMFFSCVRSRGGANDNPTALEFMFIMRKLLFRNSIRPSINANCTNPDYENSAILEFRSVKRSIVEDNTTTEKNETDKNEDKMPEWISIYFAQKGDTLSQCNVCEKEVQAEKTVQLHHILKCHKSIYDIHKDNPDTSMEYRIEFLPLNILRDDGDPKEQPIILGEVCETTTEELAKDTMNKDSTVSMQYVLIPREEESKKPRIKREYGDHEYSRKRSWVWKYFDKLTNIIFRCNICKVVLSIKGCNTNNMNRHIRSRHPLVYKAEVDDLLHKSDLPMSPRVKEIVQADVSDLDDTLEITKSGKQRSRSWVWTYFKPVNDTSAKCNLCNRNICHGGNATGNMNRHIRMLHKEVYYQYLSESEEKVSDDCKWVWQVFANDEDDFYTCKICQYKCLKFTNMDKSVKVILHHLRTEHGVISGDQIITDSDCDLSGIIGN